MSDESDEFIYQPNVGVDADGHCIVCGLALEYECHTLDRHECPDGFKRSPKTPSPLTQEELADPDYMRSYVDECFRTVDSLVAENAAQRAMIEQQAREIERLKRELSDYEVQP